MILIKKIFRNILHFFKIPEEKVKPLWNWYLRKMNIIQNFPRNIIFLKQCKKMNDLPIPSGDLIYLVANSSDLNWFFHSGKMGADSIINILEKNHLMIQNFDTILDFGCGIGRVLRHFSKICGPKFFGCDYNPKLINWCLKNIHFANFRLNFLETKLNYPDEKFDFIYVLSVFTHLKESQQFFWITELSRVLRPGGYMLITTHGEKYLSQLTSEGQEKFRSGNIVINNDEQTGTNICSSFHPESYVRNILAKHLTVVDFIPEGAKGNPQQDVYLLKKN